MQDSIWLLTLSDTQRHALEAADAMPSSADVVIVGAGLIGLATAYYLVKAGITDICVLDRSGPLAEASGANAGGLWLAHECAHLGQLLPLAKASGALYDALAAEMPFDLARQGVLELFGSPERLAAIDAEAAVVRDGGFEVHKLERNQIREVHSSAEAALLFPHDGQLNPVKLGAELVASLRRSGVRICAGVEVFQPGPPLKTTTGDLQAGIVVIACGAWTPLVTGALGWRPPIKPMRGQLLAIGPRPHILPRTIIGEEFYYWQLPEGYIAGGGTIEDVGFDRNLHPSDLQRIHSGLGDLFPELAHETVLRSWTGFRPYCEDLLPVIGRIPGHDRTYVAAGHFRKGVMLAPVTGQIIADLIATGRSTLPIDPLRPDRFA